MHFATCCCSYLFVCLCHRFSVQHTVHCAVQHPERPKGAKDEVKRPEGPPARSRGPEGPYTSSTPIKQKIVVLACLPNQDENHRIFAAMGHVCLESAMVVCF